MQKSRPPVLLLPRSEHAVVRDGETAGSTESGTRRRLQIS